MDPYSLRTFDRSGLRAATWLWLPGEKSSLIRALLSFEMSSGNRAQPRFLRLIEVMEMTGMGKIFIYARMKDGAFPKQIHLGPRTIVWNEREVVQWMEDRMASR